METFLILIIVILGLEVILLKSKMKKLKLKTLKVELDDLYKFFIDSVYRVSFIVTDLEGKIKIFNKGAEELLGYKREEVVNIENPIIFHDKEEIEKRAKYISKKFHKHMEGFDVFIAYSEIKGYENREWTYIKKDGTRITVDLYVSPILDENGIKIGYVGIGRDIYERLNFEKDLKNDIRVLHKKINEKNKIISNLTKEMRIITYNLSHSVKTPLHGISQISEWIREDYANYLNNDAKELLDLLGKRVEKLNGLINNLLEYTNIKKELQKTHITDVHEVITNLINYIEVPNNIQIIYTSQFPKLKIGKKYIETIFSNLIDNSIKYMDKEEGFIEIGMIELKRQYIFFVKDNGPGIDEKYHDKVFDMFQSLNEDSNIENLGVGLTLTKKIVEIHGGAIRLESRLGEGTSVFFTLPMT